MAMTLQPLVIACPQCGSTDVFYSCEPKCCFNHVCSNCRTTFEPFTTRVGEVTEDFAVPPELEPTAPAAPCARCGEARVFAIAGNPDAPRQYVCAACRALLTLELGEIAPG
ncbi:MAG: hypothetical protein LAP13_02965 [Acidobacteriia bacterium]|nr:hypothetical protein [Terriglobia bacterium]